MVTNRWKFDRILLIWMIATVGLNLMTHMVPTETAFYQMTQRIMNFPTYAYGLLVLTWMVSLRREISDRYVRWKLVCGGAMLLHIILFLTAFFIVLYRCRIYAARQRWWLPPLVVLPGIILWGIYYANGGTSPQLYGVVLYNIQEVHLWIFLGMWESCILIGLIPSASLAGEREWIREGILRTVSQEYTELKRRANLELIADERGYLNTRELSLAVKETFVYEDAYYEHDTKDRIPLPAGACSESEDRGTCDTGLGEEIAMSYNVQIMSNNVKQCCCNVEQCLIYLI